LPLDLGTLSVIVASVASLAAGITKWQIDRTLRAAKNLSSKLLTIKYGDKEIEVSGLDPRDIDDESMTKLMMTIAEIRTKFEARQSGVRPTPPPNR
jgi:hypothetical protein